MPRKPETPEEVRQREYRERTKSVSADRLVAYELNSLQLAVQDFSNNLGKRLALIESAVQEGLLAIALAASKPEDNSAEVKDFIGRLHAAATPLKEAIERDRSKIV